PEKLDELYIEALEGAAKRTPPTDRTSTAAAPPRKTARTLADRVSAIARQDPGRTAIVAETVSYTYAELASRAAALAGQLLASGATRGDRIILALPRSADAIVAMLAILHAGCSYVPVDPDVPVERLRTIVEDAKPSCAIVADVHAASTSDA